MVKKGSRNWPAFRKLRPWDLMMSRMVGISMASWFLSSCWTVNEFLQDRVRVIPALESSNLISETPIDDRVNVLTLVAGHFKPISLA